MAYLGLCHTSMMEPFTKTSCLFSQKIHRYMFDMVVNTSQSNDPLESKYLLHTTWHNLEREGLCAVWIKRAYYGKFRAILWWSPYKHHVKSKFLECEYAKKQNKEQKPNKTKGHCVRISHATTQPAITCSKLTIEKVEQGAKYVQS